MLPQRAVEVRRGVRRAARAAAARWPRARLRICSRICACSMSASATTTASSSDSTPAPSERAGAFSSSAASVRSPPRPSSRPSAEAHEFNNGRQFAAWLGLTPQQYSTGGKTRLGHITRARRSVPAHAADHGRPRRAADRDSTHTIGSRAGRSHCAQRRGYHRACVAIAAKNARIVWALLAKSETAAARLSRLEQQLFHATALRESKQQVRPAFAEPDQLLGRLDGRLTIEERTRGLHRGQGAVVAHQQGRLETRSPISCFRQS